MVPTVMSQDEKIQDFTGPRTLRSGPILGTVSRAVKNDFDSETSCRESCCTCMSQQKRGHSTLFYHLSSLSTEKLHIHTSKWTAS